MDYIFFLFVCFLQLLHPNLFITTRLTWHVINKEKIPHIYNIYLSYTYTVLCHTTHKRECYEVQ